MTTPDTHAVESTIPAGLTISEYRALRCRPVRRSVVARILHPRRTNRKARRS